MSHNHTSHKHISHSIKCYSIYSTESNCYRSCHYCQGPGIVPLLDQLKFATQFPFSEKCIFKERDCTFWDPSRYKNT